MENKEEINIASFTKEWLKIQEKLEAIAAIPSNDEVENHFEGVEIDCDEEGNGIIYYRTYSSYSGCGDEHNSFAVDFTDINKPISFFEDKYKLKAEEKQRKKEELKKSEKEREEEREKEQFERLKVKYGK